MTVTGTTTTAAQVQPAHPSWMRRLLVALTMIVVFSAAAAAIGSIAQRIAAPDRVAAVAPQPVPQAARAVGMPLVVTPAWLREQRSVPESPLIVIDLSDIQTYEREHVPGAVHAWPQDGMDQNAATYGQALSPNPYPTGPREWFRSLGIDASTRVVAYDDRHGQDAARLVWLMAFVGLENGAVLNGGLAAWKGAGLPVSNTSAAKPPSTALATDVISPMVITTPELASRLQDPALMLVDIRTPDERSDTLNDTIRTGTIPSSIAIPWNQLMLDESGQLRSNAELRTRFARAGLSPDREVVIYGQFGRDTGLTWLALRLAGYGSIRVYDEGWALWASRADLPITP